MEVQRNHLLMGIAMAANIGGTGVMTGTPPNLVAPDILGKKFGEGPGLTFASWMVFAIPVMLVNLILAWLWLPIAKSWQKPKAFIRCCFIVHRQVYDCLRLE